MTISLVIAMEKEAAGIIENFALSKFVPSAKYEKLPLQFFKGRVNDQLEISVTIPGKDKRYGVDNIGTEPAAVAAFASVMEFEPVVLINAGTAGSFASAGATVGKVYLSEAAFYFHDHRIPLLGWDQFGKGAYPSHDVRKLAMQLGLPTANVSSGNSLDFTEQDLETIKSNGASLKEMEAGAIAWVAFITETPFFAIKSVTNLIDTNPDSPSEFEKNFSIATKELTKETVNVVRALAQLSSSEFKSFINS